MQGNRIEIVIDTQAQGDASAELTRLRQTLDSIRQAQANLQSTAFNAFSRAQIQPQIAALDELAARVRKVATEMQVLSQTVQPATGLQSIINTAVGADRAITSAAASARVLRTSLSAAAEADNRLQQATEAQRRSVEQLAEARARAFARPASQMPELPPPVIRAAPVIREIEADVDRLAKRLTQLQQLQTAGFGQLSQGFAASAPGIRSLSEQIEEAHIRLNDLIASGAQGQSQELQGILGTEAARERNEVNQKLIADSVRMIAAEKAVTAAIREGNQAQLERLRNANIARIATRPQIETAQQTIERTTGVSQSAFSSEQIEEMTKAWPQMGRAAGDALGRTRYLLGLNRIGFLELQAAGVNTFQALASGMNPVHVAVMESSQVLGALVQGGLLPLKATWAAIISPVGLVTAAVTGVAAAVGLVVYNMRQANEEFAKAASSAMLQGRPTRLVEENARAMAAQMQASGGLGRVESRTGAIAVQIIPNISAQARTDIQESFEALTRTFEGDAQKAAEFIQQTFGSTSAMKAFVDQNIILNDELRQTFNDAVAAGDGLTASGIAAQGLRDRLQPTIDGLRQARSELGWLGRQLDIFGVGFENLLRRQTGQTRLETPTFAPGTQRPTEIDQRAIEATEKQLRAEEDINVLLLQRRNILAGLAASTTGAIEQGRFVQARQEVERRLAESHTPLQQEAHNIRMAQLQAELAQAQEAAEKDSGLRYRVLEITRQIADETANYQQGALNRVADAAKRTSAEEIAARQRVREEARRIQQDQLNQSQFESQFRVAARPVDISVALMENQKQINQLKAVEVGQEDQLRSKQLERLGLIQQLVNYETQANSARLAQADAFAQARGDLAAIVELRRQDAVLVQRNFEGGFASDAQRIQSQTALIQAQIQAQQKSVQLTQQATEQANQFATNRSQTNIAALNLEVTQYNITKTQAIQAEIGLTRSVMEQNQARLRSLLQTQGLTVDQRAQINTQLAGLYEEDAQKQIELQSRLTESIRAENERRLQYMKNFFDQVGSSAADVLIAGITKSQTRTEALQGFARSVVTSFIKEASSMASQFAGKGLASMLGVKIDPSGDTGIGTVLSKWIGSQLGLTKDEPKVDQAAISEKMKLAGDTQKAAADIMLQAAQTMTQKAQVGPYAGGAGTPEVLKAQTPVQTVQPYKPSAAVDYGAPGEYGVGQPANKTSMVLSEPTTFSSTRSVSGLPAPRASAWMNDPPGAGLRNIPGLDQNAQSLALEQFKNEIRTGVQQGNMSLVNQNNELAAKSQADAVSTQLSAQASQQSTQVLQTSMQTTQQSVQATQTDSQKSEENSKTNTENTGATKELTAMMKENSGGGGKREAGTDSKGLKGAEDVTKSGNWWAPWVAEKKSMQQWMTDTARKADPNAPDIKDITSTQQLTPERRQEITNYVATLSNSSWSDVAKGIGPQREYVLDSARGYDYIPLMHAKLTAQALGKDPWVAMAEYAAGNPPGSKSIRQFGDTMTWPEIDSRLAQQGLNPEGNPQGTPLKESNAFYYYRTVTDPFDSGKWGAGGPTGFGDFKPQRINPEGTGLERIPIDTKSIENSLQKNSSVIEQSSSAMQRQAQVSQDSIQAFQQQSAATRQDIQTSQLVSQNSEQNSQTNQENTQATKELTSTMQSQAKGGTGAGAAIGSGGGSGGAAGQTNFSGGGSSSTSVEDSSGFIPSDFSDLSVGGIIPSAAEGLHVQETSLPNYIRRGILELARGGQRNLFSSGRLTSIFGGPQVRDGKGGRLAIVHPGELILPAAETRAVLGSIPSSEDGYIDDFSVPFASTAKQMPSSFPPSRSSGSQSSSSSDSSVSKSANQTSLSLTQLSSVVSVATTAASLFGLQLSGTGQTIMKSVQVISSAMSLLGSFSGGGGGGLSGITGIFGLATKLFGFEKGGVVPSAAGGMLVSSMSGGSGQLSILHPREMVLPARLSEGIQNMINNGSPASTQSNTTNAPVFNYEANVSGYHPYESRRQFEGMLRNHGAEMQEWVENSLRNGMFKPA